LLEPAHIDPQNNYRYYTVDQLPRIHRIMALKEVGLSLDQIAILLIDDLSTEQIRGMLRLKQAEIDEQIQTAKRQMSMVEFRLRMVEAEAKFPQMDVVLKELTPLFVLGMVVKKHHTKEYVAGAIQEAIKAGTIISTGVTMEIFYGDTIVPLESPEIQEGQHEVLLGVETSQEDVTIPGLGQLVTRTEPGAAVAATLMMDSEDHMENFERVALMKRWAVSHGYGLRNQVRYWSHRGVLDTPNPEEYVIEAQLPLDADN
jgi:DNA-binding transcriptional MerR regulator